MISVKGVSLSTVDVPLTKAVYRHVEAKNFQQAHAVACLGVTQVNGQDPYRFSLLRVAGGLACQKYTPLQSNTVAKNRIQDTLLEISRNYFSPLVSLKLRSYGRCLFEARLAHLGHIRPAGDGVRGGTKGLYPIARRAFRGRAVGDRNEDEARGCSFQE